MAVSYFLPPSLSPQSIQIGRLLYHLPADVRAVSGGEETGNGLGVYADFSSRMKAHLRVPFRSRLPRIIGRILRRCLPWYSRCPDQLGRWTRHAEKAILETWPDLVLRRPLIASFGEPMSNHRLAYRLKARFGWPWLAHFSDPWACNPFRPKVLACPWINRRMESQVFRSADRLIFTTEESRRESLSVHPVLFMEKASVLPHSFETRQRVGRAGQEGVVVRHLGSFYQWRTPVPFLKAWAELRQHSPEVLQGVRVEFVGGLPRWMDLLVKNYADPRIHFHPAVSYQRSLELMDSSDLLLCIEAPAERGLFMPSKLVEYTGSSIPIFAISPAGSSAALVQALGGWVADPHDIPAVTRGLRQALEFCKNRRSTDGLWGDPELRAGYSVGKVVDQFMGLANACLHHAR